MKVFCKFLPFPFRLNPSPFPGISERGGVGGTDTQTDRQTHGGDLGSSLFKYLPADSFFHRKGNVGKRWGGGEVTEWDRLTDRQTDEQSKRQLERLCLLPRQIHKGKMTDTKLKDMRTTCCTWRKTKQRRRQTNRQVITRSNKTDRQLTDGGSTWIQHIIIHKILFGVFPSILVNLCIVRYW